MDKSMRMCAMYLGLTALLLVASVSCWGSMMPAQLSVKPTVTINQVTGQLDPTNTSPIRFSVVFSKTVKDFRTGDVTFTGTAPGTLIGTVTGSGKKYTVTVTGMTGSGTVIASLAAGVAHDAVGNASKASTSRDNTVTYDITPPTVTINQAAGQADPTNTSPIHFTVIFSEVVTDFTASDVTLSGTAPGSVVTNGTLGMLPNAKKQAPGKPKTPAPGIAVRAVTGSGTTYDVAVTGMTGSGTVIASLAAGIAHDAAGNASLASTSTDNVVTYDVTSPGVTINQAIGQADPINASPIHFTVVFNEAVTDFATGDVTLTGTAPGTLIGAVTGSGTTYDVSVTGMTGSGTVIANLLAGVAHDVVANASTASTSTDNTVTYDVIPPTATINQAVGQLDPTDVSAIHFTVVFSETVTDFATGDVTLTAGTAPGTLVGRVTGSGTTYDVAVTGMTDDGTVIASLAAGVAHDAATNATAASTSTDNTVTYDIPDRTILIDLESADSFGAFGGSAGTTNQGVFTVINGNIGTTAVSTAVTGFHDSTGDGYTETTLNIGDVTGRIYSDAPPPVIYVAGGPYGGTAGTKAIADAAALDALNAYNDLAGLPTTGPDPSASGELSGLTLGPGVYKAAGGTFNIQPGGTLTLDAGGNGNAVWVFQMDSSLTVGQIGAGATPARVVFQDGVGQAANVFWQVGSAATINTGAEMVGTIIANSGVSFSTAGQVIMTVLDGRALSLNASVTMTNTIINVP